MESMQPTLLHWILGGLTLVAALSVVLQKNAVVSAMFLMVTLFVTAGMYFALGAPFVAAAQILIYAGAIAVLFMFVVMLLNVKSYRIQVPGRMFVAIIGLIAGAGLLVMMLSKAVPALKMAGVEQAVPFEKVTDVKAVAQNFLSLYMIPFQATGFLVLAAVMGAIVLGKPKFRRGQE